MNKFMGPAMLSCIKQNEKYKFEGLTESFTKTKQKGPWEFQSLARQLSIEWHHIYYSLYIVAKSGSGDVDLLRWLVLFIMHQSGSGHLRSNLKGRQVFLEKWFHLESEFFPGTEKEYANYCENLSQIRDSLIDNMDGLIRENSELFGELESHSPFIYEKDKQVLYLRKFHKMESGLLQTFDRFSQLAKTYRPGEIDVKLESYINEMNGKRSFPLSEKTAVITSRLLSSRFLILSGGPGTGKTTTITALLRLIRLLEEDGTLSGKTRIRLAAPTGRAANRMIESINGEIKNNHVEKVDSLLPEKAYTLHKLLGINPMDKDTLYNEKRPIPADLIILDEASMVDARLMSLLFKALSPEAALLLVGDKDQLPSVDAGAVFGDMVDGSKSDDHKFHHSVIRLEKSWRSNSEILDLAKVVIDGKGDEAIKRLHNGSENIQYEVLGQIEPLLSLIVEKYKLFSFAGRTKSFPRLDNQQSFKKERLEQVFSAYEDFAVLIPSRKGLYGVERINQAINLIISKREHSIYHGQPIMITSNDYNLSLFNGDRGVFLNCGGEYYAVFRDGSEKYRYIPAGKINTYETAYAQTIHKSQGSEFKEVLMIIAPGAERLLTREIVYTGITRAKDKLMIKSSDSVFTQALSREVIRHSGIKEFLRGKDGI